MMTLLQTTYMNTVMTSEMFKFFFLLVKKTLMLKGKNAECLSTKERCDVWKQTYGWENCKNRMT